MQPVFSKQSPPASSLLVTFCIFHTFHKTNQKTQVQLYIDPAPGRCRLGLGADGTRWEAGQLWMLQADKTVTLMEKMMRQAVCRGVFLLLNSLALINLFHKAWVLCLIFYLSYVYWLCECPHHVYSAWRLTVSSGLFHTLFPWWHFCKKQSPEKVAEVRVGAGAHRQGWKWMRVQWVLLGYRISLHLKKEYLFLLHQNATLASSVWKKWKKTQLSWSLLFPQNFWYWVHPGTILNYLICIWQVGCLESSWV